jgi:hypothetical protein
MKSDFLLFIAVFVTFILGMIVGIGMSNISWQKELVEKNVAEWQVDKNGIVHFVIKPQGERL